MPSLTCSPATNPRLPKTPPILTFQPSNADRISADLAEVQDTIFKSKWREIGMEEVIDDLVAWLCPGGRAFLQTTLDSSKGPIREMRGDALVPVMRIDQETESWQPILAARAAPARHVGNAKA